MTTSLGTKTKKKQPQASALPAISEVDRSFEEALIALEEACQNILVGELIDSHGDSEQRHWQQRLKNIITPVSLALGEHKGPRRFHFHYRHREDDASVLHPVMEPSPIDMLAHVCETALDQSETQLAGMQSKELIAYRNVLERSLRGFLHAYDDYKESIEA